MSHLYLCDGSGGLRARIACIFKRQSVAFGQQKRVVVSNERDDSTIWKRDLTTKEVINTFKIRLEMLASSVPVTDANVATFSAFSSSFLRPRPRAIVVVVVRPVVVVRRPSDMMMVLLMMMMMMMMMMMNLMMFKSP